MHWVLLTEPGGNRVAVNLENIACMSPRKASYPHAKPPFEGEVTAIFYGAVATTVQGGTVYANTQVLETIEEIMTAEPIELGFDADLPPSRTVRKALATARRGQSKKTGARK
jgi:hypothetical protein